MKLLAASGWLAFLVLGVSTLDYRIAKEQEIELLKLTRCLAPVGSRMIADNRSGTMICRALLDEEFIANWPVPKKPENYRVTIR